MLRFWLLDLTAARTEGWPEIRLWGIDGSGRRVVVIDRGVFPAYYLLPPPSGDAEALRAEVERARARMTTITRVEVVGRRYFGRPIQAVRVEVGVTDPQTIAKQARQLAARAGAATVLEDDLRYSIQYLLERHVAPCAWHEIPVRSVAVPAGWRVDAVLEATGAPRRLGEEIPPLLRLASFAAITQTPLATARARRGPVVALAAAASDGRRETWPIEAESDEPAALRELVAFIARADPDFLFGWATNLRGFVYLLGRARDAGVTLALGRDGGEPHPSAHGHVSVTGRAHVDVADLAEDFAAVKRKTLPELARYLGYATPPEPVDELEVAAVFADPARRPRLRAQAAADAELLLGIGGSLLDDVTQLAALVGLPADQVMRASPGFRAEQFLLDAARRRGELAPKRGDRPAETYPGGLVTAPRPGLHDRVAVVDFRSLYPSVMIRFNVSPDTYVPPEEDVPQDEVHVSPSSGHRFRKEPPGLYKAGLLALLDARRRARERLAAPGLGERERRILDARQKGLKIIANATYGYAGWAGARWYLRPVAEAVADWGRALLRRTTAIAQEVGLEILYADTDGLFVREDPTGLGRLFARVHDELGFEIQLEKVYERLLLTEAKKRYAGLLSDGRVELVGFEGVRGDWTALAKDTQEEVVRRILSGRPLEETMAHVREVVAALRARKVAYSDLILWKTITRPLHRYEALAPHVAAARRLAALGHAPQVGDAVGYVIVAGSGRLSERAVPYQLASPHELDIDYYVENQILPAAMRVLEGFGVSPEAILDHRGPTSVKGEPIAPEVS